MANEQEQQLVGQESGISAQPSPDQQPNLYQTITAMNPMQMLELKKRTYYEKPSTKRRQTKNLQKLRYKYKQMKENN